MLKCLPFLSRQQLITDFFYLYQNTVFQNASALYKLNQLGNAYEARQSGLRGSQARRSPRHGAKVLEANTTWEASENASCCSHLSFDLEAPARENASLSVLAGYFISRTQACYSS